ncbi:MAG: hypothetical protein HY820_05315, partial [Acidobacteria bacterium]|nr:hypothetical protein [Acidobacteriota bacterium]
MSCHQLLLLLTATASLLRANISNPPLAKTGAPGEGTCAECHTGTPKHGGVVMSFTALSYTPGVQQTIQVHINSTNFSVTGFEITARLASNELLHAGRFTTVNSDVSVRALNGIEYVSQTRLTGTTVFGMNWTPPSTDVGPVRFYVTAVGGDHSNGVLDANVYKAVYTMPAATRDVPSGFRWVTIPVVGSIYGISDDGRLTGALGTTGFVRDAAGVVTNFTIPQATTLVPFGINSSGRVAGYFTDSQQKRHAFIREPAGTITVFDVPNAVSTQLNAINDSGLIVGSYKDSTGAIYPIQLTNPPNFTAIDDNGLENPTGISTGGNIGGTFHAANLVRTPNGPAGLYNCIQQGGTSSMASINDNFDVTSYCATNSFSSVRFFQAPNGRRLFFPTPFQSPFGPIGNINSSGAFPVAYNLQNYVLTPCITTPTTTSFHLPSTGGTITVPVTSSVPDCVPITVPVSPSESLNPVPGSTTSVSIGVSPNNTGAEVTRQYLVAGSIVSVTVGAAPCSYSFTTNTLADFPAIGGSGVIFVNATSGCAWTVSSNSSWITFPSGASGTGHGSVLYVVAPNNGTTLRSAAILLGDKQYPIAQGPATSCAYSVSPNGLQLPAAGATGQININTGSTCVWSVSGAPAWITLDASTGIGSAAIRYTAAANSAATPRTASLSIPGAGVSITQAGTAGFSGPLRFVALAPCRIADTRNNSGKSGSYGPPQLVANSS